jgi:hypothetical protein
MNTIFQQLKLLTQGWIIAMIAAYDDSDKIQSLLKKYVGQPLDFHFIQNKTDSGFIAIYQDVVWIGLCGTRNWRAWASNVAIWRKDGFHSGIATACEKLFNGYWRDLLRHTGRPIKIAGQSRGSALALYLNKLLREAGCRDVESFGWTGLYIAAKTGIDTLKRLGVRHTHFFSDPSGSLPSDPTDQTGCVGGKHYGTKINLGGFAWLFDHGYKSITTRMVILYILWSKHEPKFKLDSDYLATTGMEIALK